MKTVRALKFCFFAGLSAIVASAIVTESTVEKLSRAFVSAEQPQNVVRVRAEHQNGNTEHGSGVLIRSDLVLTAHHVIRDARQDSKVLVEFKSGLKREAEVIRQSKKWDLALLQFDSVLLTPAKAASSPAVKQQEVTICGFPGGGDYAEVVGRVVGFRSPDKTSDPYLFVVSNKCESGMSGGPVFNDRGEVVGTLFGSLRFANCTGLEAIKEFLNEQPIPRQARRLDNPSGPSEVDGGDPHPAE